MKRFWFFALVVLILSACQPQESEQASVSDVEPAITVTPLETAVVEEADEVAVESPVVPTPVLVEPDPPVENTPVPPTAVPTETAVVPPTPTPVLVPTVDPDSFPEGALIGVNMTSKVGVLLDELPPTMRDRVADTLLARPESDWVDLAIRQVDLTQYRLNFRGFTYNQTKGQLPLPPPPLWNISLIGEPARETIDGHDLVIIEYLFSATILTDADSPLESEPQLAEVGGVWNEPYILPVDPDLLFQRTGNACLNEGGFPPNSYDSENARIFYDYTCTAEDVGPVGCHRTVRPQFSCLEGIDTFIGRFQTSMRFERLPWDKALADQVRVGDVTHVGAADMHVVAEDLAVNRIVYRYFDEESCALGEGAIGAPGWRRLLQFDATLHNLGTEALHIGAVVAEDPGTNIFKYNACHDHFHFSNYGTFIFNSEGNANGVKQAFCVESTSRYSNNEYSPLVHPYTCRFQGIQAGWVDEYGAGLDVQWIDITDLEFVAETAVGELGFVANPEQFLCEGVRIVDENGNTVYEPSGLRTDTGLPISRPACEFVEGWELNNEGFYELEIPAVGGLVTQPCNEYHIGPLRNCGFTQLETADPLVCTPGETVNLSVDLPEPVPQVVRVCEVSDVLGQGVPCTFRNSIVTRTAVSDNTAVSFVCPAVRDYTPDPDDEDAPVSIGGFSLYTAPVFPEDVLLPLEVEIDE